MTAHPVIYDEHMKADYRQLFKTCSLLHERMALAGAIVAKIAANRGRYESVSKLTGVPWYMIGLIHNLECSLSFEKHLHNGDPLAKKTTHVPKDRPLGNPPWTWEQSAVDALHLRHLDTWKDWTVAGILFQLEGFNGYGYRQYHPDVKSPYLWSFTNHYSKGKYAADGVYDKNLVSQQLGAAAVLKHGADLKAWEVII